MDYGTVKRELLNVIFSKAMPNYVIPIQTNGHRVYKCKECGDEFIFESSYNYHINRKSMLITYACQPCGDTKIYYNRCNLLSHIRSHTVKSATINITDLSVCPLPYNRTLDSSTTSPKSMHSNVRSKCLECKKDIPKKFGIMYKDRAAHYMQLTDDVHTCPVCLFTLPTLCGMKAHMRLHLRRPPYICPECGVYLTGKNVNYPYNHDCEGFRMMRATSRLECPMVTCEIMHPTYFEQHIREKHYLKIFKCPVCFVACFKEDDITAHLSGHNTTAKPNMLHACELCHKRFIDSSTAEHHFETHNIAKCVYPCWTCDLYYKSVDLLLNHHGKKHDTKKTLKLFTPSPSASQASNQSKDSTAKIYRVVKRCSKCRRSFAYKCKYDEIKQLPTNCPYTCVPDKQPTNNNLETIICHMCKNRIPVDWNKISEHYASHHPNHKCINVKISLPRIKVIPKKINKRKNLSKKNKTPIPHNCEKESLMENQMSE